MVASYGDLPYNPVAPGSLVDTGSLADRTGQHWPGTLRGNDDKPPVGCTGVQQVPWCPQAGATAAAKGCGGNQWLNPKLQSGGDGYSMPAYGSGYDPLLSKVTGPYAQYPIVSRYQNVGVNSDLSHGVYNQNTCMDGGKRRKYHKGSVSVSRPGHKDFMTHKGSKLYSEKRLQKLIGRKTMRAPVFPYVGLGGRRHSRRFSKKQLKEYLKKVKRGGNCGCGGSIVPYGGEPQVGPTAGIYPMSQNDSVKNMYNVTQFNKQPVDTPFGGTILNKQDGFIRTNFAGGKQKRRTQKKRGRKSHKKYQKGGRYCQYLGNQPFSMGYGLGGVNLSASESALASPPPQTPYPVCSSKFPGQP